MSKKLLFLLIMVLALTVVALGCAKDDAPAGAQPSGEGEFLDKNGDGVLTLGVLVPTTGSEATYGQDMLNSYQMACDEINEAGGILGYTLELNQQDDACDPAQATTAASKIVSADVDFVVGGYCSGATSPCLMQFYDAGLIFLCSAANSNILGDQMLEQTFVINASATLQIETLKYLCDTEGLKKIAIIHQGDDYTQNLSNVAEQYCADGDIDAEVVTVQVMEKGAADVSAIVTAIKQAGADLVFWCGYYADGSNVIKQLRQGGYEGDIVCGDGSSDLGLIEGSGPAGDGVYVLSPPYVDLVPGGEDYISKYSEKYGGTPRAYSTLSYDTIYLLADAIERAGGIGYDEVCAALREANYTGMEGTITFTEGRQERGSSNFMLIKINAADAAYELVAQM